MPPIARICQHIEGTSVSLMAEQLGLDGKKYHTFDKANEEDEEGEEEVFDDDPSQMPHDEMALMTYCKACNEFQPYSSYYHDSGYLGIFCKKESCNQLLCMNTLENNLRRAIHNEIRKTYKMNTTCDEFTCNNNSSVMSITGKYTPIPIPTLGIF